MDIEEFHKKMEEYFNELEQILNSNSYPRNINVIISIIKTINNILYGSAIGTFVLTTGNLKQLPGEFGYKDFKLLLDDWSREKNEKDIDYEIFLDFENDLTDFSKRNPDFTKYNGAPILLLEYFQKYIWLPIFAKYETRVNGLTCRLNDILDAFNDKYQIMIDTQYQLISPFEFEELISELFNKMGYLTEVTSKSGDYGVDVIAKKENEIIAIQAKKYSIGNNVGNRTVQMLIGAMAFKNYKATKGVLVTTSDYTIQAHEQAKENPVELWNLNYLNKMITKYFIETNIDNVYFG
ncbi:MAG: restriction endonuclease [Pelodictyon phaeoclathratiforme]